MSRPNPGLQIQPLPKYQHLRKEATQRQWVGVPEEGRWKAEEEQASWKSSSCREVDAQRQGEVWRVAEEGSWRKRKVHRKETRVLEGSRASFQKPQEGRRREGSREKRLGDG